MARMFPDVIKSRVVFASRAEEAFYDECRRSLGSSWSVFYSCTLSSIEKNYGLKDNEIDFVLYHPRYGLIAIEVKGGRISYEKESNNFYSINRLDQRFSIKNPFQQVLGWKSRFIRALRKAKIKVPVSHAVCFPSVDEGEFPAVTSIEPEVIIGKNRIKNLESSLKSIVKRTQPEKYLRFDDVAKDVEGLLVGHDFSTKLYFKDYIDTHELRVKDIESLHDSFIIPVTSAKRLGIEGEAGTGKTVLALNMAQHFRSQGKSVLLLSSNQLLTQKLAVQAGSDIKVMSYTDIAASHEIDLLASPKDFKGKHNDWVQLEGPSRLMEAVSGSKVRYDVVICDEAQDVQPFWWDVIEQLLNKSSNDSRLYIFFDRSQGIFGSGSGDQHFVPENVLPIPGPYFPLVNNYRTTQEIARFSRSFRTGKQVLESHSARLGYLPEIITYIDEKDAKKKLDALVAKLTKEERLSAEDITILSARKPKVSPSVVAGSEQLGGVDLYHIGSKKGDQGSGSKNKIAVSTVGGFKGLETNIAILINFSEYHMPVTNPIMASLIYVACTRAKHALYVFVKQDDSKRRAFEQALKKVKLSGAVVVDSNDSDYELLGNVVHYNPDRIGWLEVNDPKYSHSNVMFFPSDVDKAKLKNLKVGDQLRFRARVEGPGMIACDLAKVD